MIIKRNQIIVRKTSIEDLREIFIIGLNRAVTPDHNDWDADLLSGIFSSSDALCYTAVRRKQIFGFLISSLKTDSSGERTVFIHRALSTDPSNIFILEMLFEKFFTDYHEGGFKSCGIEVKKNDETLINILQKYWFAEESQISFFKFRGCDLHDPI